MNNSISRKFLSCSLALLGVLPSSGWEAVRATGNENLDIQEKVSKESESSILPSVFKDALVGVVVGAIGTYIYHNFNSSKSSENLPITNYCNTCYITSGISNLGHTCYMNSAIQQLYNLDHFRESVMNDNSGDPRVNAVKYLFSVISGKEREDREKLSEAAGILGYKEEQEDPNDFILTSLDPLFEKYGMINCISNPFSLSLNLKGVSLQNILDHGGVMDYSAARELLRKKLNKGKEVSDEEIYKDLGKLTEKENFNLGKPLAVNLVEGQFGITINRTHFRNSDGRKVRMPIGVSDTVKKHGREYALTGVVVHVGEFCYKGHYISYKKGTDKNWYLYSDSDVCKVDEEKVKDDSSTDGVLFIFTDVSKL